MSVDLSLPRIIIEELKRKADEAGISIDEYLFDIIVGDSDPNIAIEKYLKGAQQLIEQAEEEIKKENLRQASEKVWGACALAVKAHALARKGARLESYRDLWMYKNEIAKEIGDWIRIVFKLADSMHKNFYENLATREDVEDVLKEVKKLVKSITRSIKE